MEQTFKGGAISRICERRKDKESWTVHSGSGMNSVSLGTCAKLPLFQSALACSIRSLLEETKFHQICRERDPGTRPQHIHSDHSFLAIDNVGARAPNHIPAHS